MFELQFTDPDLYDKLIAQAEIDENEPAEEQDCA